jgi:hypothetical protein
MPDEIEGVDYETEYEAEGDDRQRRSLGSLISLLVAVAIIIIVLLMLRSCGERASGEKSQSGKKTIEAVEGFKPLKGAVSVWIAKGASIDEVVSLAGVQASDYVSMGGGRYIIDVPAGTEETAAKALARTKGCYDAGRVYEQP